MTVRDRARRSLARIPGLHALARLTVETFRVCMRYRVTGLASEAAFFALLSLPPLVLGLFGGVGFVGAWVGQDVVNFVIDQITQWAERFLTTDVIASTLVPTIDDVLKGGRADLLSLGFVLSLWSGSRALNVFVDTISIMYGQSGVRGIVQTRALSFSLYVGALLAGVVAIPLLLIGPTYLDRLLPSSLHALALLYWPVVTVVTVASMATLFHIATPRRGAWIRDIPGAVLTLIIWALASFVVRGSIAASIGGTSIYGPLSAPIVLMIWLYALAIAVLIGAALNAAIRELWPSRGEQGLRASALRAAHGIAEKARRPLEPVAADSAAEDVKAPVIAVVREGDDGGAHGAVGGTDERVDARIGGEADSVAIERELEAVAMERDPQFGDGADDRLMSVRTRSAGKTA